MQLSPPSGHPTDQFRVVQVTQEPACQVEHYGVPSAFFRTTRDRSHPGCQEIRRGAANHAEGQFGVHLGTRRDSETSEVHMVEPLL